MRMARVLVTVAVACAVVVGSLFLLGHAAGPSAASRPVGPVGEPESPVDYPVTRTYTTNLPFVARAFEERLEPDDPRYVAGHQWGLQMVHAPQAWYHARGDGVVIAIIDTGVDLGHPDLAPVLWTNPGEVAGNGLDDDGNGYADDVYGWDFVDGDGIPQDENGHGTHVAGIAGGATNNSVGIASIGWGARIMPLRVLAADGRGDTLDVMNAIYYAVDHGAQVINLSLGGYSNGCGYMAAAIAYAKGHHVSVVAAAGNDGNQPWFDPFNPSNWFYPAACTDVLGVGATNSLDQRAYFSNYGWWVDVAAPGVNILSTYLYGWYGTMQGTSMATPFVSGLAALLYARYPEVEGEDVAEAIMVGADDLGTPEWDPYYGAGRINAVSALYSVDLLGADAAVGGSTDLRGSPGTAGSQPWRSGESEAAPIDAAPAPFRPGELIVQLRGTPAEAGIAASEVLQESRAPGVYLIRVPAGQELARARALRAQGRVLDAHPNYILSAAGG